MDQEVFKEMLKEKGLKVTTQRMLVLETIASHPGEHLTAEAIYEMVRKEYPEIGLATIYRTVSVLVDLNVIDKVSLGDGFVRYELKTPGVDCRHHHHHAICLHCGAVLSFEDDLLEQLEQALYDRAGFTVTDHEVKLYGCCAECEKAMRQEEKETK